ncbi:TTC5 protein, partial [Amia calva]|nr:TTC5 protein [Amia calva]
MERTLKRLEEEEDRHYPDTERQMHQITLNVSLSLSDSLQPELVPAWNCLGEQYWRKGDLNGAKTCFTGALQHCKNKESLRSLSMVLRQLPGRPEEREAHVVKSLDCARQALQLDITDGTSWYILGNAYISLFFSSGQTPQLSQQALSAYTQAEKVDSTASSNPDLHFNRATLYQYEEMFGAALAGFCRAGALDPGWSEPAQREKQLLEYLERLTTLLGNKVCWDTGGPDSRPHIQCSVNVLYFKKLLSALINRSTSSNAPLRVCINAPSSGLYTRHTAHTLWTVHSTHCAHTLDCTLDTLRTHSGLYTRHTAHTLWTVHSTHCAHTLDCTLDTLRTHSGLYTRHTAHTLWTVHSTHCAHTLDCTLDTLRTHSGLCTRHTAHTLGTVHSTHCTHSGLSTQHTAHTLDYTLDTLHTHSGLCTRHTAHTLWTIHSTHCTHSGLCTRHTAHTLDCPLNTLRTHWTFTLDTLHTHSGLYT